MISDILWTLILASFAILGFKNPYIILSGVVFVDILRPQSLSFSFLANKPVSLVMTGILILSMLINIKKINFPEKISPLFLVILFMVWITFTTYNAEFPTQAWWKYDFVIKTILFSLFIPFIINTRVKFDTFIAILVCSISFFTIALGMKTVMGGGGYGYVLFQSNSSNAGMTESSTMAMVAVMNIPLILYLNKHSIFRDQIKFFHITSRLLIFASVMSVIGTFARTGLIGLCLWIGLELSRSKKRIKYMFFIVLAITVLMPLAPQSWLDRMITIGSASEDSSAFGRIVVWKWTIDYVKDRPLAGGGFQSYIANAGELYKYMDQGVAITHTKTGKAFHNIYFEVLGEQGYVGLLLYLLMILSVYRISTKIKNSNHTIPWVSGAAIALRDALMIYCACGMFIGVAYYPWIYYFTALAIVLYGLDINTKIEASNLKEGNPAMGTQ